MLYVGSSLGTAGSSACPFRHVNRRHSPHSLEALEEAQDEENQTVFASPRLRQQGRFALTYLEAPEQVRLGSIRSCPVVPCQVPVPALQFGSGTFFAVQ